MAKTIEKQLEIRNRLEAPLAATIIGALKLVNPCITVSPLIRETIIKKYDLIFQNGLRGSIYMGVGNRTEIEAESKHFGFIYDISTSKDFIRSTIEKTYSVLSKFPRGYIVFAYIPRGAWIDPVEKCRDKFEYNTYHPIPPVEDIDKVIPRNIGDAIIHVNNKGVGVIGVAVSPVYIYLILGYGLTMIPKYYEEPVVVKLPGETSEQSQ